MDMLSKLMDPNTYINLSMTYLILGIYLIVVLVTTTLGYVWKGKSGIDYGIAVGLVISIFLWFQFGKKRI